jgi:hypothetical protein
MRLIAALGTAALTAVLAGCGTFTYPDDTMFFFPIYDKTPRADLVLRSIACDRRSDGTLAVSASVENHGADVIWAIPLLTGDRGAFRVVATVTTVSGGREEVDAVQLRPLMVADAADLRLAGTYVQASDVARIDVVADPDHIVPDPLRQNNELSWQGRMSAASASCTVTR